MFVIESVSKSMTISIFVDGSKKCSNSGLLYTKPGAGAELDASLEELLIASLLVVAEELLDDLLLEELLLEELLLDLLLEELLEDSVNEESLERLLTGKSEEDMTSSLEELKTGPAMLQDAIITTKGSKTSSLFFMP